MWTLIGTIGQDLRYAGRMMRRSPGFTAVAIGSLALGIGANTAIFTLLDALILRPLPVRQPQELVEIITHTPGDPPMTFLPWKFFDLDRKQNHVFTDMAGVAPARLQNTPDPKSSPTPVEGQLVSGNLFSLLGVQPAIGRLITADDDVLGSPTAASVVLSWPYWQRTFNGDPTVVGRPMTIENVPATIVGVAPREFFGLQVGSAVDLWIPIAMAPVLRPPTPPSDGRPGVGVVARMKPGVSLDEARAELRVLDRARTEELAVTTKNSVWRQATIDVQSARSGFSTLRYRFGSPLLMLFAGVCVLLLITCTNIASLLLARGSARHREMSVRVALGASRWRLARQVLTEALLLAALGGVVGLWLAFVGADALIRIITSGRPMVSFPGRLTLHVQPDLRILLFTSGIALVTGLLFGAVPAVSAWASAPALALRDSGGVSESRSRRLFGKSLVVMQVALSLVLLSAAGLFAQHLSNLRNVGTGFRRASVLLVKLDSTRSGYERIPLSHLYQELLARLQSNPNVRAASLAGTTPISGAAASRFVTVEGFNERSEDRRYVMMNWISPQYFGTFGTRFIAGRDFRFDDEGQRRVAIVNQSMARYYFGNENPIGKHVGFFNDTRADTTPYEIVGVVGDAKYTDLHEPAPRTMYFNAFQEGRGTFSDVAIRTTGSPWAVVDDVRRAVEEVLKTVTIAKVTTLDDQVNASVVPERLIAGLSSTFGALGALLAALGLYGLLAYTVARRITEIGIRMALGATEGDIMRMVLKSAVGLVSLGLVVGAPFAMIGTRLAGSLIEGLSLDGAVPMVIAAAVLIPVALVAAYLPARRAARVQPMQALRNY